MAASVDRVKRLPRRTPQWFERQLRHVQRVFAAIDKQWTPKEIERARRALGYPKTYDEV